MEIENLKYEEQSDEENNILNLLQRYIIYWKWFVLSICTFLTAGYLYIRHETPLYEANATVLIKDDKKGGGLSELSAFEDLGLLNSSKNIDNEIEVLKSRALMTLVASELRLNVQYFVENDPIDVEYFENPPIYIRFVNGDSAFYNIKDEYTVKPKSNSLFKLADEKEREIGTFRFGETIDSPGGPFIILATSDLQKNDLLNKNIRIVISPMEAVVDGYRKSMKIDPINKTSNVISITLRDNVKEKAIAIVDNLIQQHNTDAIADKNLVSRNTANFINDRIRFIAGELSEVESEVEQFKTSHKLVDVESEAKLFLETGSASEVGILEANTQKALADYMYDYILHHNSPGDLIPSNLGLSDPAVANTIVEYNKLVLNRNRIFRNSTEKNPVVENLDHQLEGIRESIRESLKNYQSALKIKINELTRQEAGITSKIATVPKYERQYRMIQRQQQIKETLYLYLLQKREETNIALAVTVANAKVIDGAYSNGEPVSPKKKLILLAAFILGFAVPIVILYIRDVLDNKVHGKRDIDQIGVPFLGDIPNTQSKSKIVVSKGDNSSVAEAFRLLRTNVDFMMSHKTGKGRTLFLTSTLGKEGKSFIALNLSISIALSGKRVLLMGMDIRAPKILEYLQLESSIGLTSYIANKEIELSDIIIRDVVTENLDIVPSGAVPPNPAELLLTDRVGELFNALRSEYDYIIVDTAPIGMVTDTLLLSKYADAFVYVVRAYYLDKRLLSVAEDLYKEKRLPNMAILINGTDKEKGYGYGYGYGYGGYGYGHEKPRPMWKRLLQIK